jgi:hypothetical protein
MIWSHLRSPNPFRISLVRHLLYKLNKIGDKQHACLTPLPVFTQLVSPRCSRTLTLWAMYKLLINFLSRQSISVPFTFCILLGQLPSANTSTSISKVRSAIILIIAIAFLVPFPPLNPNWYAPNTPSVFLSILLSIFATTFAVCAIRLIVRWSLHFVACGFLNLIKTESRPLHLKIQSVPRCKHFNSVIKNF